MGRSRRRQFVAKFLEEVSLYIHIPFCTRKCPYCHFATYPFSFSLREIFLNALFLEWDQKKEFLFQKKIISLYFGGGTPYLLGHKTFALLLEKIRSESALDPLAEITIEANPEDVTFEEMKALKELGINRISLGIQSLKKHLLQILGRNPSPKNALQGIENTLKAGFSNLSCDLLYELPGQTFRDIKDTFEELNRFPLLHLSFYNLTFEPNTPFFRKKKVLTLLVPQGKESLKIFQKSLDLFKEANFVRYEISAFARLGFFSRHNIGYWTLRPFLGFGPSAFSYWDKKRFRNILSFPKWKSLLEEKKSPVDFEEKLPYPDNLKEALAIGLRTLAGVDLEMLEKKEGPLPEELKNTLKNLQEKGFLEQENSLWKLSEKGVLFYDSVAEEII